MPAIAEDVESKDPVEETEEILKSEADNLRTKAARADELEAKETSREGYTGRKIQEATKPLEARITELEDEKASWETGDKDVDALRTKVGQDHITNVRTAKDLADQVRVFNETKLQSLAENLAVKYGIDAGILGEAKNDAEMENIALKAHIAKESAEDATPKGLDRAKGGRPSLESEKQIIAAFVENPTNNKVRAAYYQLRRDKGY